MEFEMELRRQYGDLSGVRIVSGNLLPKTWSDSELSKINTYNVKQLDSAQSMIVGSALLMEIRNDKVSKDLLYKILLLAISLPLPGGDVDAHLLTPPPDGYGTQSMEASIDTENNQDDEFAEAEAELLAMIKEREKKKNQKKATSSIANVLENLDVKGGDEGEDNRKRDMSACAYCCLAAHLLRLAIKTPESFLRSIENFKARYQGWYDDGSDILVNLELTAEFATSLRQALERDRRLVNTWVMWVAYNENEGNMDRRNSSMLDYLAGQVFSYNGMKGYQLTMDIQRATMCDMSTLLSELKCGLTRQAVLDIEDVLRHEKLPNRKTYFRYSRVFDPGYFSNLQTKKCRALVYVLAKTYKEISTSTSEASDPLSIHELRNLGDPLKQTLDQASANLVNMISKSTVNHKSHHLQPPHHHQHQPFSPAFSASNRLQQPSSSHTANTRKPTSRNPTSRSITRHHPSV
uniref:Uncharacterized protein n=1 Tax=Populus davidiana TaxID=266767 RepID=A0A6M2F110_9ROSI